MIVKDHLWKKVEENRIKAQISFEPSSDSSGQSAIPDYKTPFVDHKEGEGVFINPRSILRMTKLRFESNLKAILFSRVGYPYCQQILISRGRLHRLEFGRL